MPTIPVTMRTVDMATGLETDAKEVGFQMLGKVRDGHCDVCAVKHDPHLFHDCQSLHYQYSFYARQRRWPTWADACAHCSPEIVANLRKILLDNAPKLQWSEPPAGVKPIAHLGETVAEPERGQTPVPADAVLQPGQEFDFTVGRTRKIAQGKVLAVVPVGVSIDDAIADQNGQPRMIMVRAPTHTETIYVLEIPENGRTLRREIGQRWIAQNITPAEDRA